MSAHIENYSHLAALARRLAGGEGIIQSPVGGVKLVCLTQGYPRVPVMYDPCIIIVLQGSKVGYSGGKVYRYDANNYLVLSVPLPFECETIASPEEPLISISISVDITMLQEVLMAIGDGELAKPNSRSSCINSIALTEELLCATERLLDTMSKPLDARVLGPHIVREIVYYVLCGGQGDALQALANRHTHFSQIAKSIRRIQEEYAENITIEALAQEINMSVSAFHHNFKAVTSNSPLQYLKSYRLHKARMLMLSEGAKASSAAMKVGYESASQFSREFKRMFGHTPLDEINRLRENRMTYMAEG